MTDIAGKKVTLSTPHRGERKELIQMASTNAEQIFEEKKKKEHSWEVLAQNMIKKLHLTSSPEIIECLDISNISGTNAVGSLICFHRGEPDTKRYRHYKIATVTGPDDYSMMREVLDRRFARGVKNSDFPDLLLVDGGKGQLGIAEAVAREHGVDHSLELMGIAKEKEEEGEKLYKPGRKNPILLKSHNPVLLYLMRIRDESHRFGVTFHRSLRKKRTITSELDRIPGIGAERKKLLLSKLGSIKRISSATIQELENIPGIGRELALDIHTYFKKDSKSGC